MSFHDLLGIDVDSEAGCATVSHRDRDDHTAGQADHDRGAEMTSADGTVVATAVGTFTLV